MLASLFLKTGSHLPVELVASIVRSHSLLWSYHKIPSGVWAADRVAVMSFIWFSGDSFDSHICTQHAKCSTHMSLFFCFLFGAGGACACAMCCKRASVDQNSDWYLLFRSCLFDVSYSSPPHRAYVFYAIDNRHTVQYSFECAAQPIYKYALRIMISEFAECVRFCFFSSARFCSLIGMLKLSSNWLTCKSIKINIIIQHLVRFKLFTFA